MSSHPQMGDTRLLGCRPLDFENANVLQQLRCGGVLEAVRISCAGFPTKFPFEDFVDHFWNLVRHPGNVRLPAVRPAPHASPAAPPQGPPILLHATPARAGARLQGGRQQRGAQILIWWSLCQVPELLARDDLDDAQLARAICAKARMQGFQVGKSKVRPGAAGSSWKSLSHGLSARDAALALRDCLS